MTGQAISQKLLYRKGCLSKFQINFVIPFHHKNLLIERVSWLISTNKDMHSILPNFDVYEDFPANFNSLKQRKSLFTVTRF